MILCCVCKLTTIAVNRAFFPNGLDGLQVDFDAMPFILRSWAPNHERKKSMIFVPHGQNLDGEIWVYLLRSQLNDNSQDQDTQRFLECLSYASNEGPSDKILAIYGCVLQHIRIENFTSGPRQTEDFLSKVLKDLSWCLFLSYTT